MSERTPLDMLINREVLGVVLKHLTVPVGMDGDCGDPECDNAGEHGGDHVIAELVKYFGLPWKRCYDRDIDGYWPPPWVEGFEQLRKELQSHLEGTDMAIVYEDIEVDDYEDIVSPLVAAIIRPADDDEAVSLYEVRCVALDAALRLQENVKNYNNAQTLIDEAQDIYDWLTTDFEDAS